MNGRTLAPLSRHSPILTNYYVYDIYIFIDHLFGDLDRRKYHFGAISKTIQKTASSEISKLPRDEVLFGDIKQTQETTSSVTSEMMRDTIFSDI